MLTKNVCKVCGKEIRIWVSICESCRDERNYYAAIVSTNKKRLQKSLTEEMFFDGENIRYEEIINTVTQHPQEMKKILTYVFDEIKKLWEYMGKKTDMEKHFHKEIHELQEEYNII